jgi:hypothetical protein
VHGGGAVFVIRDGRVVRFTPRPDLASALAAAGLSERDEVPYS